MQNRLQTRGQGVTLGLLAGVLCLGSASGLTAEDFFDIEVAFEPPAAEAAVAEERTAVVAVTFLARNDDVHINEQPSPRLRLAAEQSVLEYEPPKHKLQPADPKNPKYLDLSQPVRFEVKRAEGAPEGLHAVQATVTYFYCSSSEHWCRRGNTPIEIPVQVPAQ